MKRELSVFILAVRSSVYKILAVLILMSVSQIGFFGLGVKKFALQNPASLERMVQQGYMEQIFYIAFLLVYMILIWTESEKGSQSEYTLQRLSISRESVFFLRVGYHICCFFILFAVQIFLAIGIGSLYLDWMDENYTSSQSLFLAFWRNDFLHSLLPLAEVSRWIRNGLLIVAVGLETTFLGEEKRQSKRLPLIWFAFFVLITFSDPVGCWKEDLVKGGVFLLFICLTLIKERIKERMKDQRID